MIEISPEELLPENFADFKKQIPDLKIADRLSAENPLKPLLTAIENHRQSGMLFKTIVVLLLTYLTLLVAAAFFRGHPSAWGMLVLRLPVYDGVLKHFYPDYKNYSYLPAEDTAIHKSVAVYVDKSQRMPATAATCYTKKEGQFLPCFSVPDELPLFRENHKDRQCFLLADDLLNSDASVQKEYLSGLLRALVKTKK